jgi:hypothetical protein
LSKELTKTLNNIILKQFKSSIDYLKETIAQKVIKLISENNTKLCYFFVDMLLEIFPELQ